MILHQLICIFCWATGHVFLNVSGIAYQYIFFWALPLSPRWSIRSTSHIHCWRVSYLASSLESDQHSKGGKQRIIIDSLRCSCFQNQLINLKEFSMTCCNQTLAYDEVVLPTLQRMINLEKLSLYLVIDCKRRFIDGNHIKETIIRHTPQLKDFVFDIRSIMPLDLDPVNLPSDEDVRCTLTDLTQHPVISYVDCFLHEGEGHCHLYTCPYSLIEYKYVSNNFPRELFGNVRYVELFHERPFEHSFFLHLNQSFPSMTTLTVTNRGPQIGKQHRQSSNENDPVSIIKYRSLRRIHLVRVHDDYVEQFLFETKTFFSDDME